MEPVASVEPEREASEPEREASVASEPVRSEGSRDDAICDAALSLLAEVGYDNMSMDAIASRARASKATIYRHWSGKRELVVEAMRRRGPACIEVPDTGTLRGDALATLRQAGKGLLGTEQEVITAVLRELRACPEIADYVRGEMHESKRAVSRTLTERAVARGELPPDADPDLFFEIAPALIFFRATVLAEPIDEAFLTHVVDDVILPLMQRPKTPATGEPMKESA
ncbi:AcrR family transcriptional regulator [Motilibacter peucedani]|uniref:AcrR family transcriptional regulator n=1 Tax=Motilibacter peucedani TaxID=598650 RepID=A0A420XLJ6_9ACTN|nr:TetR/AcrR family transcriptional regulator [Motilibacter peucedani]RKS71404.1 AcrR family transcriptional regulator [Motilibacter peucedani]